MRILTRAALLVLLLMPWAGSQSYKPLYFSKRTVSLTGSALTTTLVNPTSNGTVIEPQVVYIKSSVAISFSIEMDGATPGGTPVTIQKGSKALPSAVAVVYGASSVGAGVSVGDYEILCAGCREVVPFDGIALPGDGTNSNFSVKYPAVTATVTEYIGWLQKVR